MTTTPPMNTSIDSNQNGVPEAMESASVAEQETPNADWTILEDERVEGVCRLVAGKVGNEYSGVTTPDDQYQDAAILVATDAGRVREYLAGDPLTAERYLFRWLYTRLLNAVATDAARSNRGLPLAVSSSAS